MRPVVTFDETGVRSKYGDGSCTFVAWEDIWKIELVSLTEPPTVRGRFFLFWGSEEETMLIPYCDAALTKVQQSRWLPDFNSAKAKSKPIRSKNGSTRATFWERPGSTTELPGGSRHKKPITAAS
jgi:hypothetical protein